jgi:hypothetical protein
VQRFERNWRFNWNLQLIVDLMIADLIVIGETGLLTTDYENGKWVPVPAGKLMAEISSSRITVYSYACKCRRETNIVFWWSRDAT